MTIQGAIADLNNLLNADDIPFYYKGSIEKVIETIEMEFEEYICYNKANCKDRKVEEQKTAHWPNIDMESEEIKILQKRAYLEGFHEALRRLTR